MVSQVCYGSDHAAVDPGRVALAAAAAAVDPAVAVGQQLVSSAVDPPGGCGFLLGVA